MPMTFKFTAIAVVALASSMLASTPASAGPGAFNQVVPCPWAYGRFKNTPMTQRQCDGFKSSVIKSVSHTRYKPGVQTQPSGLPRGPLANAVGAYQPGMATSVSLKRR
jgi:hypothetical protein